MVTLKVNSSGYGGHRLSKTATAMTNDPKRPAVSLTISGMVDRFADIQPERLYLKGMAGEPLRQSFSIRPEKKYPFKIVEVTTGKNGNISVELVKPAMEGGSYTLNVENTRTAKGRYREIITLKTDSKIKPFIDVSVYGVLAEKTSAVEGNGGGEQKTK